MSEEENLVCNNCPAQFVPGWVEEYEDDTCPDCGGEIQKAPNRWRPEDDND